MLKGNWPFGPDRLPFEHSRPSLDLPVAMGVKGSCPHVTHPAYPNEFLEVLGNELRAVMGDNLGTAIWKHLALLPFIKLAR
jgi:hypothetical protein